MLAKISSAVLVQMNGRGSSFQVSIQSRMSALSWRTERCAPRLSLRLVSSANQRSTRFSQLAPVGVKCNTNLGCAVSQRWIAGVLCVAVVVQDQVDFEIGGDLAIEGLQELFELDRSMALMQRADHLA